MQRVRAEEGGRGLEVEALVEPPALRRPALGLGDRAIEPEPARADGALLDAQAQESVERPPFGIAGQDDVA
jgi:hypothetical protein